MTTSGGPHGAADQRRLLNAAQHHARKAVGGAQRPYTAHAALDVVTHCGAVVELLAKAMLIEVDPRLIQKMAHHHLLDLSLQARGEKPAVVAPGGTTTIDAATAVEMVRRLDASLTSPVRGAHAVLRARNAAAHMAIPPLRDDLQEHVAATAAFATTVLALMDEDAPGFWGEYAAQAVDRVQARSTRFAARARRLVEQARVHYEELRADLSAEAWQRVLQTFYERRATADFTVDIECPACTHDATLLWSAVADFEYSDGEWNAVGYWALDGLRCPVCSLQLDGEEVEALNLPDMPDVDELAAAAGTDDFRDLD